MKEIKWDEGKKTYETINGNKIKNSIIPIGGLERITIYEKEKITTKIEELAKKYQTKPNYYEVIFAATEGNTIDPYALISSIYAIKFFIDPENAEVIPAYFCPKCNTELTKEKTKSYKLKVNVEKEEN
ncbi:hypothetical protein HY643_01345 [Candidatus Woesearchaeota archaeon]|nr:hypothetical protein [Candidatus Woesearchaeota archaeon]